LTYSSPLDPAPPAWDAFVAAHREAHLLQTAAWGELKSAFGYSAERVAITGPGGRIVAGALILFRRLPLHLGTRAYIPAGPLLAAEDDPTHPANVALWQGIHRRCRQRRAVFLKVEPCDWYRPRPTLADHLAQAGLRPSPLTEQPPRTIVLDLSADEEAILKRMNQSTRYKCKLREKKQIDVREASPAAPADIASFIHLMSLTGQRDQFGIYPPAYYARAFDLFAADERCALLLASYAGRDLAGVMTFRCGENAYYLYGASSNEERNRMPTYILQWEAIRWAKRHGAIRYDLWGIPDAEESALEAQFEQRQGPQPGQQPGQPHEQQPIEQHEGLWGVYGFKRGFGGRVVRSVGAWDRVYNPILYAAYQWALRRRGREA
jgi:lipid II:glycine glycyltransferase (peptidoglycan interpeptide bridge formation enzyme)